MVLNCNFILLLGLVSKTAEIDVLACLNVDVFWNFLRQILLIVLLLRFVFGLRTLLIALFFFVVNRTITSGVEERNRLAFTCA